MAVNVLGTPLQECGTDPLTGFFRDGCCNTGADDMGIHTVCALMTEEFTFSGVVIDPVIIPEFRMVQVLQSFFSIAVVGITASIFPAYQATKIDVGEALKFE